MSYWFMRTIFRALLNVEKDNITPPGISVGQHQKGFVSNMANGSSLDSVQSKDSYTIFKWTGRAKTCQLVRT